jgi:hypothetical protein
MAAPAPPAGGERRFVIALAVVLVVLLEPATSFRRR